MDPIAYFFVLPGILLMLQLLILFILRALHSGIHRVLLPKSKPPLTVPLYSRADMLAARQRRHTRQLKRFIL